MEWLDTLKDEMASLFSGGDNLTPPRRLIDEIGGGSFEGVGREFTGYFTKIGGLKATDRVLDVGCGCGRMAVPLIPILDGSGEYFGFDISRRAIAWCRRNITRRHPRFQFELADIYNTAYKKSGTVKPWEYRFPYADNFFDFTFLTSVFTHLQPREMEHYVSEIGRTLRPGGKCMASFFLLNDESRMLLAQGKSAIKFQYPMPYSLILDPKSPEAAISFEEPFVRGIWQKYGFQIIEPVHFGSWPGRQSYLSFQDILLLQKN